MTRVLVTGGRDYGFSSFEERVLLRDTLDRLDSVSVIIEGGAKGADRLAAQWAQGAGVKLETYPADWEKHGRAAGPIRNAEMLSRGKPDLVLAFRGGSGTLNMVAQAERAGVKVMKVGW